MLDLELLVRQASTLQPLPRSASKLATLVSQAEPDLQAIAAVVEFDPAFTAALLRRANSATAGANRTVSTVREAVTRLGVSVVLKVITELGSKAVLDRPLPEYGLRAGQLWEHSRVTAIASELLGRVAQVRLPPETSTTALLHDMGKLVLSRFLDQSQRDLLDSAYAQLRSYRRAEQEVLGVTQCELGGILAEHWSLPRSIVHGITHYHAPDAYADTLGADHDILTICHAVHLANALAKWNAAPEEQHSDSKISLERTARGDTFDDSVLQAMRYLGIDGSKFSALMAETSAAARVRLD